MWGGGCFWAGWWGTHKSKTDVSVFQDYSIYMVSYGSLFCSNIRLFFINLCHLRHLCNLCFDLQFYKPLCEVVEQPTGFLFFRENDVLEFVSTCFVILHIVDHVLLKVGRKLNTSYAISSKVK